MVPVLNLFSNSNTYFGLTFFTYKSLLPFTFLGQLPFICLDVLITFYLFGCVNYLLPVWLCNLCFCVLSFLPV